MKRPLEMLNASRLSAPGLCAALACLALPCLTQAATAQDFSPKAGDIAVRLGAAWVTFDGDSDLSVWDMDQPHAGIDISDNVTVSGEVEYFFTPNFAASLTLGIPPETTVEGTGDFEPYGALGDIRYGLAAVMAKYHYTGWGRFQPFVGAGLAYFMVFDTEDAAISDLEVDDSLGAVVQIGADMMVTERFGLFASVSHAFMDTDAKGTVMMGAPAEADITLDPTVVQVGLTVRF